jgi:hypothetical protein
MKKILFVSAVILLAAGCSSKQANSNQHMMNGHMMNNADMSQANNQSQIQSHRTYSLNLIPPISNIAPAQSVEIKFNIKDEQGNILKDFEVEHTKLLHFIVVRKDLQYFQHIHPSLDQATGEFSISLIFPADGPYKLYADYVPGGAQMGPEGMKLGVVSSQDIMVGDISKYNEQPVTPDTESAKAYNGYSINFKFPEKINTNTETKFGIIVSKNGKPVTDLEDYLGALAHTVIIGKDDLSYQHLHAVDKNGHMMMSGSHGSMEGMTMGDTGTGPDINFSTSFTKTGTYKIFTQFQEQGKVTTTDYTVEVK